VDASETIVEGIITKVCLFHNIMWNYKFLLV
ncbi:MAG: hypothetical protein ACI90V_004274, partial [Bacillariaceae sp.]|jgi:hypothetical protein